MPLEQALEELRKYAQDFASVGDAKEAIKKNKDAFLHKWIKVMQYYRYIERESKFMGEAWIDAVDILADIYCDNHSLEEWVDLIIDPKRDKQQEKAQTQEETSFDTSVFANEVEACVSEIMDMQGWDPDNVHDIEEELTELKDTLLAKRSSFSPTMFQSLMDDIDASLGKISKFNDMLNSEAMESIKRM